jgi:hypothetical protein
MTKIKSFHKTRLRINEDFDFVDKFIVRQPKQQRILCPKQYYKQYASGASKT